MKQLDFRKIFNMMAILSIVLALLVVFMTVYALAFRHMDTPNEEYYLLPIISFLSLFGAIMFLAVLRPLSMLQERIKQTEDSVGDLNKLHATMREQRHDFMNHLQVVHSLIELERYSDSAEYIQKVYNNIEKVSSTLKTSIPAVNAILAAKRSTCENKGIEVIMEIRSALSGMHIPEWELCKTLGNIIDNAVNALEDRQGKRWIKIEMFEDIYNYVFKISNNGPAIPPELWESIFTTGYTTRKDRGGEGMGLSICRRIVSSYGGKLRVFSDDSETVFEGVIPRKYIPDNESK
ncbi:MAG: Spo0B domain-containing protein [Oscillospiraceae bacterium]|nr:Spo0B domain-containing protein [Oscillospiraceae bacterium]